MTLVGVVKFNDSGTKGGENDAHDIIMAKGREFIFGRNSKTMYINFHDGKNWVGTTMGGTPAAGVWTLSRRYLNGSTIPRRGMSVIV